MSSKGENNKDPSAETKDNEKAADVKSDNSNDGKDNEAKVNESTDSDVKNGSSVTEEAEDEKGSEDDKDASADEDQPKNEVADQEVPEEKEKKERKNEKKSAEPAVKVDRKKAKKESNIEEVPPGDTKDSGKDEIPEGPGTPLGEIPRVDASISRFKNDDLKLLHQVIFEVPGKALMIKKNIRKFDGFGFAKGSEDYNKKLTSTQTFEVKQLKSMCEMLDLEKKGSKEEIAQRIVEFLIHPKDSGKVDGGGRPKRTAAVRANNRGYSSHDDSYSSDEKRSPRGRRDKGKRSNLKDESSNESDEDFQPSDASEEKVQPKRRQSARRRQQSDNEISDEEDSLGSSEESNAEEKVKKRKVANNKGKIGAGRGRGRKPAQNNTTTPKKRPGRGRGKKVSSESEDEDSSENEPLIKKTKLQDPPTDEEIKTYVKGILEGANLEEITMKTVCKQVYAHYPNFDLTHKKDYIKTTVKSLIST